MQALVSLLLTASGIVVMGFLGFVTLSLGLVLAGILSLTLLTRSLMGQPKPAPAYARAEARDGRRVTRIWNDGKGTIIDM